MAHKEKPEEVEARVVKDLQGERTKYEFGVIEINLRGEPFFAREQFVHIEVKAGIPETRMMIMDYNLQEAFYYKIKAFPIFDFEKGQIYWDVLKSK